MYETMANGNIYIQIALAVSVSPCCQAPTSLMDGVHWLNMDDSYFVKLDDTCLRTIQPAKSNYDGMYLELSHHHKSLTCLIATNRPYKPKEDNNFMLPSSNSTKQHECVALARSLSTLRS
jgi:hypothetical protein